MSGLPSRRTGGAGSRLHYDEAKRLAAARSADARRALAARADAQPEILYFLADDVEADVRRAVAANLSTPPHAGLILARDDDVEVRCNLARQIGRLAPQLDEKARARVGAVVNELLEVLARDQMSRVRRLLAEQLKATENIPAEVIQRLARDSETEVAAPVLEFSPLLDDEFLVDIIRNAPTAGALAAIARRRDLAMPVSDAVVDTSDERAIAELLSNRSAQIREETLDRLVDRSEGIPRWHEPLVHRPSLSARSIRRLSEFVAESLLRDLQRRHDIDAETAGAVAEAVKRRLAEESPAEFGETSDRRARDFEEPGESGEERAERLHAEGSLDEEAVADALGVGDRAFVARALSLLGGIAPEVVGKAVSMGSAKGVVALSWRAGLGMRTAVQLQLRLARVPPATVIQARNGVDYPLSEDEMRWQIEFFGG